MARKKKSSDAFIGNAFSESRYLNIAMDGLFPNICYTAFRDKDKGFVYTRPPYAGQMPVANIIIGKDRYTLEINNKPVLRSTLKNCLMYVNDRVAQGVLKDGAVR